MNHMHMYWLMFIREEIEYKTEIFKYLRHILYYFFIGIAKITNMMHSCKFYNILYNINKVEKFKKEP